MQEEVVHGAVDASIGMRDGDSAGVGQLTLLSTLRQLPDAFPQQTVLWVPRRSKQAASEILRGLLANAVTLSNPG